MSKKPPYTLKENIVCSDNVGQERHSQYDGVYKNSTFDYQSKPIFTTAQSAEYLNMCKNSLDRSRIEGTLFGVKAPEFIKYGRAIRYSRQSLDNWLASLRVYRTLAEHDAEQLADIKKGNQTPIKKPFL